MVWKVIEITLLYRPKYPMIHCTNKTAWMPTTILVECSGHLMLLLLCEVETFVLADSYATHLQGMSLVRTVNTVYYPQTAQAFYTLLILSL